MPLKAEELQKFEPYNWKEEIPLLDELYVVPCNKRHDSGYRFIKIYGVKYNKNREIEYAKLLADFSDVLHVNVALSTFPEKYIELFKEKIAMRLYRVDFLEKNVARYFANSFTQFRVKGTLSDFDFEVVYKEGD